MNRKPSLQRVNLNLTLNPTVNLNEPAEPTAGAPPDGLGKSCSLFGVRLRRAAAPVGFARRWELPLSSVLWCAWLAGLRRTVGLPHSDIYK